ncbi:MAG: sodium/proton-translocating pyrophosphatase, partial [Candidatus Nitrosotenuis sp.]
MEFPIQYLIPVIASIASFAVAGVYTMWVLRQNPGTKQMTDISDAVKVGAAAFLKRELKIIIPIAIGLSIVIGFFFQGSNGIAFAVGAALSAVSGIVSLKITVKAAVRSANATHSGLGRTFALAFRGGATVGLVVPAMALMALSILFMVY